MDSVGKYQIVHPDGTRLSPVDMATLAEMVYAGIVQSETELFAVATSRTIKAGEIPYLAFLISRLKESPSAPPPRLPVAEPARQAAPQPARAPRQASIVPPPLHTQHSEPTIQEILKAPAHVPTPIEIEVEVEEPPAPPVIIPEPEPEPIVLEDVAALPVVTIEEIQEIPEAPTFPILAALEPLPELATIPIPEIPLEPLTFEIPIPEADAQEQVLQELPTPVAEVEEAVEIPIVEIPVPEPVRAEPVRIEVAEPAAPEVELLEVREPPTPEPLEISLEINATAAPPPLPVETIAEPAPTEADTADVPTVSEPEPVATAPAEAKPTEPPKTEAPPTKTPPEPTPEVPDKRSGQPYRPKKLLTAQQKRNYTVGGVVALVAVGSYFAWQQTVGAAMQRDRLAIVGAWQQADGSSVVFREDGSGAMTRPDPIYGNRTHLFRWERRGAQIYLTEKRILMPGGTRQTAADSTEPVGVSPDGLLLHFSDMDLAKVP